MTHRAARRVQSPAPARTFARVLVVAKKTSYQEAIERNDVELLELIAAGDPSTARKAKWKRKS